MRTVATECDPPGSTVRLHGAGAATDLEAVIHHDVSNTVRVAGQKIVRKGLEGDDGAARIDARELTGLVGFEHGIARLAADDTRARALPGREVEGAGEDVECAVRVLIGRGDEIGGV